MSGDQPRKRSPAGLELTLHTLAKTNNEAAVGVLMPALDSPDAAVQQGALAALLDRRSPTGQTEILKRLADHAMQWRPIIEGRPGRMTHALRDGLLGSDQTLCRTSCQAIVWFREFDLFPALVTAAEDETHANADLAAATIVELADLLYEEQSARRTGPDRRDPQLLRRNATATLESSVARFGRHHRREPVVAFVSLASRDNATLRQILADPRNPAYLAIIDAMLHEQHSGVVRLLLAFLEDPHAPTAALSVMGRRSDEKFTRSLLRKIGFEPSPAAARNLKRIDALAWLQHDLDWFDSLDEAAQHSLVRLVALSGVHRDEAFGFIERMLRWGNAGGRRAAAKALAPFHGAQANALCLAALEDSDPQVQAEAAAQLRPRSIPGALTHLIALVDGPVEVVRQAARTALAEFTFERFLASFDTLEDDVRSSTGVLVKKVSPHAVQALGEELRAKSRTRRIRGLAMARAMEIVPEVELQIVALLADEDHLVRVEAARALAASTSPAAREALRQSLLDRSVVVQEAAEQSLQVLAARSSGRPSAGNPPAVSPPVLEPEKAQP